MYDQWRYVSERERDFFGDREINEDNELECGFDRIHMFL